MSTLEDLELQTFDLFQRVQPHISIAQLEGLPDPQRKEVLQRLKRGVDLDARWRKPRLGKAKVLSDKDLLPAYVAFDQSSAAIFRVFGRQIAFGQVKRRRPFSVDLSNGPRYANTQHLFPYQITVPTSFGTDIFDYALTDIVVPGEGEALNKSLRPPQGKSLFGREMRGHLIGLPHPNVWGNYLVEGKEELYHGGEEWRALDPITRIKPDGVLEIRTRDEPKVALGKVKQFLARQDPLRTARRDVERMFEEWSVDPGYSDGVIPIGYTGSESALDTVHKQL